MSEIIQTLSKVKNYNSQKMSEIELLPCPFCGGEVKFIHTGCNTKARIGYLRCDICGESFFRRIRSNDTEDELAERWNTRKPMERIVEQLERKKVENPNDMIFLGKNLAFDEAIEIVQKGVRNEAN